MYRLLTLLIYSPALSELDETQVKAILDNMVYMDHRFDRYWPPDRAKGPSARKWNGQLNTTGNVYSEFMKATKGTSKAW